MSSVTVLCSGRGRRKGQVNSSLLKKFSSVYFRTSFSSQDRPPLSVNAISTSSLDFIDIKLLHAVLCVSSIRASLLCYQFSSREYVHYAFGLGSRKNLLKIRNLSSFIRMRLFK